MLLAVSPKDNVAKKSYGASMLIFLVAPSQETNDASANCPSFLWQLSTTAESILTCNALRATVTLYISSFLNFNLTLIQLQLYVQTLH